MTNKERFLATIARQTVDRPASWLGFPTSEALVNLTRHFKVEGVDEVKQRIDDDIYPIEVPYHHPPSNHIACAFDFAKKQSGDYEERSLTVPGFFEDYSDPAAVDDFNWPNPTEHMNPAECAEVVGKIPDGKAIMGMMWSAHFQDACSAFGMETALIKMLTEPDMFTAVIDRITEFYLEANEIFYKATKGKLDAVLIGNDFGSQSALMLSPELLRQFVFPGTKKLIDQAKSYDLKVIHHSCGAIYDIIQDLIDLGVDAIHPIQALAAKMEPERLQKDFGDKVSFCGGVDTQELLVNGPPADIEKKVQELKTLFPTGLIISPSHEAILADVPPQNIETMFQAVRDIKK